MKPVEPDSSQLPSAANPEHPDVTRDGTGRMGAARDGVVRDGAERTAVRAPAGRAAYSFAPGSRVLSGYVIKRGLGQGGFGEVYYAVSDAGKDVALKLVRRNLEIELRGVMQCLNVKHPNLISLYDVKVDDQENHWIVMEYVAGERLTDVIERAPQGLPPAEAIRIVKGIGAGVGYLHDAGIVHRDLKPANIFVENGFIKIGDYGLSKFISSSRRSGQTESVGTVHYMAPEIANGRYGKQIDIYALGVLFYELLTGKLPFDGESVGEILMKHLTAEPDLAAVAEPYRSTIAAALKKDPEHRPRSVAALLNSLDPAIDLLRVVPEQGRAANGEPATAANRVSRLELGLSPTADANDAQRGFGARLFVNLLPLGAGAKTSAVVWTAVVAGVLLMRAPWSLVVLVFWVWLIVGIVRTIRGDAKQAQAAFREGRGLELRATEAHPEAPRPRSIGRRIAMAVGLVVVTTMLFSAMSTTREVRPGSDSPIVLRDEAEVVRNAQNAAPRNEINAQPAIQGKRVTFGVIGLVTLGAIVGLTIAVGRRSRAAVVDGRPLHYAAMPTAQGPPTFRSMAIDITGSILLMFGATVVVNRLLLLLMVDGLGPTAYLWSTATTFTAAVLTALTIKATRYIDRESTGRRLMFFAVGVAAGAASWAYAEYLGYSIPMTGGTYRFGVKTSSWPECYVDGVPTVLAYMGYYGLSFLAIDWWSMTYPKRSSRWRPGDAFVAVFWAGAVYFVFPFPQPWGVLTAAGTTLVLPFAFPLMPKSRTRATAQRAQVGGRA